MASSDIINTIINLTKDYLTYLLPIIGLMAGITFIVSWFMSVTLGFGRRTFKG